MSDEVLTATDVARLLKLNVETVYTLIRREGLPAARVGSQWRFSGSKVRSWFESRHADAEPTSATNNKGEGA